MSYSYNNQKIKEILDQKGLSKRKVRIALNMANDITVQRWVEGEDIYIGRLIEFCNKFNLSPLDFINYNGMPININPLKSDTQNDIKEIPSDITGLVLQKEQAIAEIKLQCKEDIFAIKEELHRQEINHIKEIAEITIRLKEEERIRLFEQHEHDMLKSKNEMNELRTKMEQLISDKDRDYSLLHQSMSDLQLQYKELEMATGNTKSMYKPVMVNEPTTYKKTKK